MPLKELSDWQELTRLTGGQPFVVERVRLAEKDIAIEGAFVPPQLLRLSGEDQVFVAAFLKSHGSIKEMEQMFGVSYPTIKARLTRISASLDFVDESPAPASQRGAGRRLAPGRNHRVGGLHRRPGGRTMSAGIFQSELLQRQSRMRAASRRRTRPVRSGPATRRGW